MATTKYQIVACVGDPWDYSYDLVDETNSWKEARNAFFGGADVYRNGKRVYFIDHESVQEAFDDLKFDEIVGLDMISDSAFEADVLRKNAADVLEQNGIEKPVDYSKKVDQRYLNRPTEVLTFAERNTLELVDGKYKQTFVAVETDELPF
jgi:hypothetical protein